MNDATEILGEAIDRVDRLAHSILLHIPAETHVEQLRELLPEVVTELKRGFVAVTGENPWADFHG